MAGEKLEPELTYEEIWAELDMLEEYKAWLLRKLYEVSYDNPINR